MKRQIVIILLAALLFAAGWAVAQTVYATGLTVTVDRTSDDSDMNPGDGLCDVSANAGDQCSLRAAIEELNALGPDTTPHHIEFNIAGSGPFTITPASALPDITVPVEIDGETQPGAACPTNNTPATLLIVLDGRDAGADADGLLFVSGSDGSTVRGLVIGNFDDDGLRIQSNNNKVRCNHIGLGADGVTDMGNGFTGVYISGNDNTIGGQALAAQHNVISGNGVNGIRIEFPSENNQLFNNYIGTTADGMDALSNNSGGIYVSANNNTIGGTTAMAGNVISGNTGSGIRINTGDGNVVQGNYVGVARDGITPLGNSSDGVQVLGDGISNVVGGTAVGEANTIAYNGGHGVLVDFNVAGDPVQNALRGNAIFENSGLGIDLGADGVDSNDLGDGDGGENEHQNYPVLFSVTGTEAVTVTLDSQANTEYSIDLYRNDSCDVSGNGEGQAHLLAGAITTDGSGYGEAVVNLAGLVGPGDEITAVATDPTGNSSEFSTCVTISSPATPTPTPTHTATPGPSPTVGPSPTPGPSPTAGPSPTPEVTPTAVPGEFAIYLPAIIRDEGK